jgi:tetratricopeptide (TPR) repeat protein
MNWRPRRTLLAPLLMAALISPPAWPAPGVDVRTQAKSAFQAGNYEKAATLYRQLAGEKNQKIPVLKEAMWSLWNMQKIREAVDVAHIVMKNAPNDLEAARILKWAPAASNKQRIRALQDDAKAAYQRNDFTKALQDYREISALDPNNAGLLRDQMWALWNTKHIQEAMAVARKLQTMNDDDRDAAEVLEKGGVALDALKMAGERKDSVRALTNRIAKNSQDAEAYRKLAWVYFNRGRRVAAAETLQRLLAIAPNDPDSWYQLGKIQMGMDDTTAAIAAFERSLAYNPSQARVFVALGKCYAQQRDLDQAAMYFGRAYELTPNPDFLATFAKVLFYRGEFRRSKDMWTQAIKQDPQRTEYRFREAEAQYYAGQQSEAIEKMQQLADHDDKRALGFLVDEAISRKDTGATIRLLEDSTRELSVDEGRNVIRLARIYLTLNRPDDALSTVRRWLDNYPNDIPAMMLKASALWSLKRPDEAIAVYHAVLDKNPKVIDAYTELSQVLLVRGDKEGAIQASQNALDLDPTNPYRLNMHARLLFDAGRHEQGRALLVKFLNQNQDQTVLPILLYHGLSAFEFAPMLAYEEHMTSVNFERQMQALSWAGYHPVTIQQVLDWQAGKAPLPNKPVMISFDDARRDSFEFADDVLEHYNLKAEMFVPADNVELVGALGYAPWPMINHYQKTGRWDIQSHGQQAHSHIATGPDQIPSLFLVMPEWLKNEQRVETPREWQARIEADHATIIKTLKEKTGSDAIGYAYPEGLYGQQSNSRIAVDLNIAAVKKYYKSAFIEDPYGMNLRSQDPYFMRRIEPKTDWNGPALLQHISDRNPFAMAYRNLIYMSLNDGNTADARKWLEQLRNQGASQQILLVEQARVEYASKNYSLAQQLAMQAFVADPSAANQKLLTDLKSHSGVVWRPSGMFQRDNQHRESWNFEQQLEVPLGSHVRARLIQGVGNFQERSVKSVRDSVLGMGVTLGSTERQQLDVDARHHGLSGDAKDLFGFTANYHAQWKPWLRTQLDARHELYGSARAIDASVRENRARLQIHFGGQEDWGLTLRGRLSKLTNDNQRNTGQGEIGLPLFKSVGLGVVYQVTFDNMRRVDDLYYSPQHLVMNELGPQLSIGNHTPFKLRLRYLPGIAKEDNISQQFVQSAEGIIEWSINKSNSLLPSVSYEETPTYNYFLSMLTYQHEF